MSTLTLVFWLLVDPITFGLGSIGAYILFNEFVILDHFPSADEIIALTRNRWKAIGALAIATLYFFYRLFSVLTN
jgi:hypothetical protein